MSENTDRHDGISKLDRRRFLQAATFAGGALAAPGLMAGTAGAAGNDTILVTVGLGGGNDWLNTVGPFRNGTYRSLRGSLSINPARAHAIGDGNFFHPNLGRLAARYGRGEVAVVPSVGEPGLDHSHFSNMARWLSANPNGGISSTGWLGRWMDNTSGLGQFGGVSVGSGSAPLHMVGNRSSVVDLPTYGGGLYGADRSDQRDRSMHKAIRRIGQGTDLGPWVDRVAEANAAAIAAARSVSPAYRQDLPDDDFVADMTLAARVINLGLGTRVLHVWQGGYDTHDDQIGENAGVGRHAELLGSLDQGIDTFFRTLSGPNKPKVILLVFSEFGRRVKANGSRGTDHGAGGSVLLIGRQVWGGIHGNLAPLNRVDDRGDLPVLTDFRKVFTTVIDDWLGGDPVQALGAKYKKMTLLEPPPRQQVQPPNKSNPGRPRDRAAELRAKVPANRQDLLRRSAQ